MLGHQFELHHRVHFAREALAAGREPDAAADAAVMRLVHPLTLHFTNRALERAYAAREFRASFPVVVIFCCSQIFCSILLVLISPSLLPVLGFPAVLWGCLTVVRRHVSRLADQARAQLIFSWCWTGFILLAYSATALVQRWTILVSGLSTREMVCIALLHVMFALFQRFIALPALPRFIVLTAIGAAHLAFATSHSELGHPVEGLLVAGALLLGELLGHPFELQRRVAFAREALAAGRVPDAAPDPAAAVHPLTLRFSDGGLEGAFSACTFTESYPVACTCCLVLAAQFGLMVLALPAIWFVGLIGTCATLALFIARALLHNSTDQARAASLFAWGWCTLYAVLDAVGIWFAPNGTSCTSPG